MTRGKWVALAVGMTALGFLVPYGPGLWRSVAYVETRLEPLPVPEERMPPYVIAQVRRFDWIPVRRVTGITCGFCVESKHADCTPWMKVRAVPTKDYDQSPNAFMAPLCMCPHPSHAQDSE